MAHDAADPFAELAVRIGGEVLSDALTRMLFATDASPYQRLPLAVVRPCHAGDCRTIVQFAAASGFPLIPRAAGTSLAGQCVGEGLVVDFSRHMNRILEIDAERRRTRVEPGVICEDLNRALRPHGLMFAPDPSTANRCTVSGMLGNNAWGVHAPRFGTTRDHVISLAALLSDGSAVRFGPVEKRDFPAMLARRDREGEIHGAVRALIDRHRDLILRRFPRPDGIPRNAGYALDVLASGQPWAAQGAAFNLARLICGSEGTLALTTEIELNLVLRPAERKLLCLHFRCLEEALEAVPSLLSHGPAALELLDRRVLSLTRENLEQQRNRFWIQGEPAAVLLVEFQCDPGERLGDKVEKLAAALRHRRCGYAHGVLEPPLLERAWALRAAGLGLLMGKPGRAKAVSGMEDAAVPVAALPAYVKALRALMDRHGCRSVIYGPVGRGVVHFRPELDLTLERDRERFQRILQDVVDLVLEFGGIFTAKHGDGRLRGPFLKGQFGDELYGLLREIKALFDPGNILNPGKLFGAPSVVSDLRSAGRKEAIPTFFDWRRQLGLEGASANCNGAGVCLKSPGQGTMCPSYMATREEIHGTRGRANIFRQVLASPGGLSGEGAGLLRDALDLCVSCKGCKSECPANVDMARMKAEFLHHYHRRFGVPWRARLIGEFDRLTRLAGLWPGLANRLMAWRPLKSACGFHPERSLPPLAGERLSLRIRRRRFTPGPRGEVVLFNDIFSEYYEPHIAIAACRVLERLGWRVLVTPCLESGRIQISQGLLRQARERLTRALQWLYPHAVAGRWILGLEPSEILTFRDEATDLLETDALKEKARQVAERTVLFEEFIAKKVEGLHKALFRPLGRPLLVHGHCHQKALSGMEPLATALNLVPGAQIEFIPSGCCGMAGAFGYEWEHNGLSLQIAELVLFPALRKAPADALVVAPGTSCRHQIREGLGISALHPAEVLEMALHRNLQEPRPV